jgi:hypothetical protein
VADLAGLQQLVCWPKLFRRLVPYLATGATSLDGFDAWLHADPVHRDDALFLLDRLEAGNMHDVIHAAGHSIALTVVGAAPPPPLARKTRQCLPWARRHSHSQPSRSPNGAQHVTDQPCWPSASHATVGGSTCWPLLAGRGQAQQSRTGFGDCGHCWVDLPE